MPEPIVIKNIEHLIGSVCGFCMGIWMLAWIAFFCGWLMKKPIKKQ
jgi:hypothetical protein